MEGLLTQLQGARTVLLAEPAMDRERDRCTSLLVDRHPEPNVLFVTYTRSPADCVDQLAGHDVGRVGVITVGEGGGDPAADVTERVSTPSDLTGLGIEIRRFLSEWETPVVCFDSLTSTLQYVEFETAYEFVHTVTGQVRAAPAYTHVHVDPDAHDDEQVAAITSLFDARVTVDGGTTVRTRHVPDPEHR